MYRRSAEDRTTAMTPAHPIHPLILCKVQRTRSGCGIFPFSHTLNPIFSVLRTLMAIKYY